MMKGRQADGLGEFCKEEQLLMLCPTAGVAPAHQLTGAGWLHTAVHDAVPSGAALQIEQHIGRVTSLGEGVTVKTGAHRGGQFGFYGLFAFRAEYNGTQPRVFSTGPSWTKPKGTFAPKKT